MPFRRGDHVCAIYSTTEELTREVANFLAEGLRSQERCWYVGDGAEIDSVRAALRKLEINVTSDTKRGALQLISGDAACHYGANPFYDPAIAGPTDINQTAVRERLAQLDGSSGHASKTL